MIAEENAEWVISVPEDNLMSPNVHECDGWTVKVERSSGVGVVDVI